MKTRQLFYTAAALIISLASAAGVSTASSADVEVTVTAYFGPQVKATIEKKINVPQGASVMEATRRAARVETNAEGTFLISIEGVKNSQERKEFWLYFVNGEPAHVSAAETKVKPGDRILWFLRRESSTRHAPD